jgi:hypothetical protein
MNLLVFSVFDVQDRDNSTPLFCSVSVATAGCELVREWRLERLK